MVEECPCINCITKAACLQRKLRYMLSICPILENYLTHNWNGGNRIVYHDRFYTFCEIMGIKVQKDGTTIILKYAFDSKYPANTEMFDTNEHFARRGDFISR